MSLTIQRASALFAVVVIPLLLAVLPLPAVLAVCDSWPLTIGGAATPRGLAERVRRWLRYGRGPWKSSCLTRSLILYALLRGHGHRPHIALGVEGDSREFVAHAWVSLGGVPVDDAPETLERFTPLMVHGG